MAPQVRLELTTLRLTAECSAIELLRIIRGLFAARLPADGSLFRLWLAFALSLGHRLGFAARPASARCPVLPYVREREKLPFLPLLCGSRQLPTLPSRSQLSTISVWRLNFCVRYGYRWCPPAIVTGNFPQGRSLSLPVPARFKLHASALTRKHSLAPNLPALHLHTLAQRSRSLASSAYTSHFSLSPSFSDQALDRLVSPSSTPHSASTDDLSTSSSLRGLTCFKQWQSSSSGGLHA